MYHYRAIPTILLLFGCTVAQAVPLSLPADFSSTQGISGFFYQEIGDSRPGNVANPSAAPLTDLPFIGEPDLVNGSVTFSGPTYMSDDSFPFIMNETARGFMLMHPGSETTSNRAAVITWVSPVSRWYSLQGAFARANDTRLGGNGVDVGVFRNADLTTSLFAASISPDHAVNPEDPFAGTGVAQFAFDTHVAAGQSLNFIVFSDSQGGDGFFDITAFRLDIDHSPIPEPSTLTLFGAGILALLHLRRRSNA
jgi:hypothetical protein